MEGESEGLCVLDDDQGYLSQIVRGGSRFVNSTEVSLANLLITGSPRFLNAIPEGIQPLNLLHSLTYVARELGLDSNGEDSDLLKDTAPFILLGFALTGKSDLPARLPGGKTSGVLIVDGERIPLISGREGPASSLPRGTSGYDIVTKTHVEGHAAALMRQRGYTFGVLDINNDICSSCYRLLPRMLPENSTLIIRVQGGDAHTFRGLAP